MQKALLLCVALCAGTVGAVSLRKSAHEHGHDAKHRADSSSEVAFEQKVKAGIVSTNMQDYLAQISELEEVESPSIAIPGQWLTDQKKAFLFLPIKAPKGMPLSEMKLLTDGKTLLVNTVERPQELPEDEATKKFRLVMAAFKSEFAGDPTVLTQKLSEWYQEEDQAEVRDLIKETIDSMQLVNEDPNERMPRAIDIPLNTLELGSLRELIVASHKDAGATGATELGAARNQLPHVDNPHGEVATIRLKGTYLQKSAVVSKETPAGSWGSGQGEAGPSMITVPLDAQFLQKLVKKADYVVPLAPDKGARELLQKKETYIKESFSVTIPYPVGAGRVFAVLAANGEVVVTMPYQPDSVTAKSDAAFVRVPIFDTKGDKLVGPEGGSPAEATLDPESTAKDTVVKAKAKAPEPTKKATMSKPESSVPVPKVAAADAKTAGEESQAAKTAATAEKDYEKSLEKLSFSASPKVPEKKPEQQQQQKADKKEEKKPDSAAPKK